MVLLDLLKKLVTSISLCDRCLGRQFSSLLPYYDNEVKGGVLKNFLLMSEYMRLGKRGKGSLKTIRALAESGHGPSLRLLGKNYPRIKITPKHCYICGDEINSLVEKAARKIAEKASEVEFNTFYVGLKIPLIMEERDEEVKSFFQLKYGEALKNELNREINKNVENFLLRKMRMKRPDVLFIYDAFNDTVSMQINSLFLRSTYKKLIGGIAQTKWRGINSEDSTPSIEKMLEEVLLPVFRGSRLKFHGAGREDVDVKMLGCGRPFIVEIMEPKVRNVDPKMLHVKFNEKFGSMVEVSEFHEAKYSDVPKLKLETERKVKNYRVLFEMDRKVSEEELREISEKLSGCVISQRTPLRVLKRRSDKVRRKTVYEAFFRHVDDRLYEAEIKCSGGLYVKELLHGDEGRTTPSVAGLLNVKVKILDMEVTGIEGVY
ncbi:MAG: tRNA pseudouridine(54/55) synthase Pus10 [Thermoproteota archaeon]